MDGLSPLTQNANLSKYLSLTAPGDVILTTFRAASDEMSLK